VIDTILALPTPIHAVPHTPHRNGSWIPTAPGRLTWLTTGQPKATRADPSARNEELSPVAD